MTNGDIKTVLNRFAPCLLLCLFLAAPPASASADQTGPLYLSAGAIGDAQTVLVHDGYLRAGDYARGNLDEATTGAIRAYQGDHFIRQHGLLDPDTMGMLTTHPPVQVAARTKARSSAPRPAGGTQRTALEPARVQRSMPATASPLPLMTGLGSLLLAGGLALLLGRLR